MSTIEIIKKFRGGQEVGRAVIRSRAQRSRRSPPKKTKAVEDEEMSDAELESELEDDDDTERGPRQAVSGIASAPEVVMRDT